MQQELIFSGFGGQGVMFVGQLLAYAALEAGKEVTWIPSYGPEMRGGTAHCFVVISDKPIGSPVVRYPKVAVVFNNPSFDKYEPIITENGLLVVNQSLIKQASKRKDIDVVYVPATKIAEEIGNVRLMNMVLLGATMQALPIIPMDCLRHALEQHIPSHRRDMLDANYVALAKGAEYVSEGVVRAS